MIEALISFLGEPVNEVQENLLYFFAFYIVIFFISCMFDIITNITKS